MERSPTLLVLLGLGLLLLWAAAAGWSWAPAGAYLGSGAACAAPQPAATTPARTAVVRQPVAAHVVQNRDIHDTSGTTGGGLRGVFVPRGAMADLKRSQTCVCTQPFCAHPRGRAVRGHTETMLTAEQQARYFPSAAGWECSDMNYDPPPRACRGPPPGPPPSSGGGA